MLPCTVSIGVKEVTMRETIFQARAIALGAELMRSHTTAATRIRAALAVQELAGQKPEPTDYHEVRDLGNATIATALPDYLDCIGNVDGEGCRYRSSIYQLGLDLVTRRQPLILDLSRVTGINQESVNTLATVQQLFHEAQVIFLMVGVKPNCVTTMARVASGLLDTVRTSSIESLVQHLPLSTEA